MIDYVSVNKESWNRWASEKCIWTLPVSHEDYLEAQNGKVAVFLTPQKKVPDSWLPPIKNKRILALASGGGQQGPLFVAAGANVTVFDISTAQLDAEKYVAERERYNITLIQGDMTHAFPFEDESFDIVFHPVSNSYIYDVSHVWSECYRVLKSGGRLLSGFANPTIYLFGKEKGRIVLKHAMPYNPLDSLESGELQTLIATDGIQFGHSFEEQIGGQLHAGFCLKDFYEDYHPINNESTRYDTYIGEMASFLAKYMPIYFATWAEK